MDLILLQRISLAVSQARQVDAVLKMITAGLVDSAGLALARIWLMHAADGVLELAASAGHSVLERTEWSNLHGEFRRVALGSRKIGHIGATGESLLLNNLETHSQWVAHPDWVKQEQIRVFAGHPLAFRGEILGVLGVFGREALTEEQFGWLRLFADQAATAISNARAFEEINTLRERLEQENEYLLSEVRSNFGGLLGESTALARIVEQIQLVAPTNASVLILGESGTGKELIARAIHERSTRSARALVKVNCASIPRDLFESEFFGHVKGAFTGAVRDRVGRFQVADGGSLFLDEVGEIPLELQGKLLRVLQEGEFERVGEDRTRKVDVRIIAATNRDLNTEVEAGRFRKDLYFRLGVFPLEVPPLRDRREDIPILASHFIAKAAQELGRPAPALTEADVRKLEAYSWPGNIRELQNVLERAVILFRGRSLQLDLPKDVKETETRAKTLRPYTRQQMFELERHNIEEALRSAKGKIYGPGGAAELLGMRPTTLASRIAALKITRR